MSSAFFQTLIDPKPDPKPEHNTTLQKSISTILCAPLDINVRKTHHAIISEKQNPCLSLDLPLRKLEVFIISEIRTRQIAIDEIGEFILVFEQIFWYVWIAVDAIVGFGSAVVWIETVADALQDLGWIFEVGLVEFGMRKGGDFVDHVFKATEARAAVPASVPELGVDFARAKRFGSDCVGTFVESRLGMFPLFFAEGPLKAVSEVDCSQTKAAGKLAVAKGLDDFRARNFVYIGYENHVAKFDFFLSCQRRKDLIHHGIA